MLPLVSRITSKLVELASEMRQHSGTSVSELKRKYNHLVPSNERVLGLAESENNMSLSEVTPRENSNYCWRCIEGKSGRRVKREGRGRMIRQEGGGERMEGLRPSVISKWRVGHEPVCPLCCLEIKHTTYVRRVSMACKVAKRCVNDIFRKFYWEHAFSFALRNVTTFFILRDLQPMHITIYQQVHSCPPCHLSMPFPCLLWY